MPKSNSSKEGSTEIVDVAGIDTSPSDRTGRDVHLTEGGLNQQVEKSAEAIVAVGNEP